MDALVAHLINHHEWVVPTRLSDEQLKRFPNPDFSCVRNLLISLGDDGYAIKVVARELPAELTIRPPSSIDLAQASFDRATPPPTSKVWAIPQSPLAHFMPAPKYLEELLARTGGRDTSVAWLLAESLRISKELQRPDIRTVVKTNVASLSHVAVESLTDKLIALNRIRLTVRREDAHGAVCFVMRKYTGSFPLTREQEQVFLREAQTIIERRPGGEVRAAFRDLRLPSWKTL